MISMRTCILHRLFRGGGRLGVSTEEHWNVFRGRPAHFMCMVDIWVCALVTVLQLRYPDHVERGSASPIFFRQESTFQTHAFHIVLPLRNKVSRLVAFGGIDVLLYRESRGRCVSKHSGI